MCDKLCDRMCDRICDRMCDWRCNRMCDRMYDKMWDIMCDRMWQKGDRVSDFQCKNWHPHVYDNFSKKKLNVHSIFCLKINIFLQLTFTIKICSFKLVAGL